MKKYLISSIAVLSLAVVFGMTAPAAHADTNDVASSTVASPGGWATPCFYVRQAHEGETGFTCNDQAYSMQDFALNPSYREAILIGWRARWLVPHN